MFPMLVLVAFGPSSNFVIFIKLFQHTGCGWIAMLLYVSHTFYILHNVVDIILKSCSYRGKASKRSQKHVYLYVFSGYRYCIEMLVMTLSSYI